MKVTQNVIHDLVPVYLSGEASADTVALVEEFLRLNPDVARTVEALRANPLPELPIALRPTQEKETLDMTRQLLRWRGILMVLAMFLTLVPLTFRFDNGRITWTFLHEAPLLAVALVWLSAWVAGPAFCICGGGFRSPVYKSVGAAAPGDYSGPQAASEP